MSTPDRESSVTTPDLKRPEKIHLPWLAIGLLTLVTLMLRSMRLIDLPIFGDEAIYLRWAQLIGRDLHKVWDDWYVLYAVPLIDPKPPMHFWLMAITDGVFYDPLIGARLISVISGVLLIPVTALIVRRMRHLLGDDPGLTLPSFALLSALMMIVCPFFAFYQRMATADALFVLEMAAALWLAMRLVGDARTIPLGRGLLTHALPFGIVVGIAMNTRQIVSYELWFMPVGLWILMNHRRERAKVLLAWLAAAFAVGMIMFMPYLLAQPKRYNPDPQDTIPGVNMFEYELRRRVLYQPHFSEARTLADRLLSIKNNTRDLLYPVRLETGEWSSGWLFFYLTPPVCLLAAIGAIMMAVRRQWRLWLFLLLWAGMFLLPLILFGMVTFSRYSLAGVMPLLFLAVWVVAVGIQWAFAHLSAPKAWVICIFLMLMAYGWPVYDTNKQIRHWPTQTWVSEDRWQYMTGWPGGFASRNAIAYLRQEMKNGPIVVITNNGWGTPADAVWAYLDGLPNVQMFYVDWAERQAILQPVDAAAGQYSLLARKWRYTPAETVTLKAGAPIFYVTGSPLKDKAAPEALVSFNHFVEDPLEFRNPSKPDGTPAENSVFVFKLR